MRTGFWITAVTTFVAVAFIAGLVANGTVLDNGDDTPAVTTSSLIVRPVLPGKDDPTDTTSMGTSARCKDGTYTFKAGDKVGDDELCKDNGGVEKRLS